MKTDFYTGTAIKFKQMVIAKGDLYPYSEQIIKEKTTCRSGAEEEAIIPVALYCKN